MESLAGGELAGIVIGSLIAGIILIAVLIYGLRIWFRGPTKGSDVNVNLEDKVVVITGKPYSINSGVETIQYKAKNKNIYNQSNICSTL